MSSKVLLLTKAFQVANDDWFKYSVVMTYGLLITYSNVHFRTAVISKALLLTKALQVANVDRSRYSFVMTYGLLIRYRFKGN